MFHTIWCKKLINKANNVWIPEKHLNTTYYSQCSPIVSLEHNCLLVTSEHRVLIPILWTETRRVDELRVDEGQNYIENISRACHQIWVNFSSKKLHPFFPWFLGMHGSRACGSSDPLTSIRSSMDQSSDRSSVEDPTWNTLWKSQFFQIEAAKKLKCSCQCFRLFWSVSYKAPKIPRAP